MTCRPYHYGKIVGGKQMTSEENIQAEHPYLYEDKLEKLKEEEKDERVVIDVSMID